MSSLTGGLDPRVRQESLDIRRKQDAAEAVLATVEGDVSTVTADVVTVTADVASLDGRVTAVEGHLDGLPTLVQGASASLSLDGSGNGTITFPTAFAAVPAMTATVQLSTSTQRTVHIVSITASGAVVRCFSGGTLEVSTTRNVHWIAIGVA